MKSLISAALKEFAAGASLVLEATWFATEGPPLVGPVLGLCGPDPVLRALFWPQAPLFWFDMSPARREPDDWRCCCPELDGDGVEGAPRRHL